MVSVDGLGEKWLNHQILRRVFKTLQNSAYEISFFIKLERKVRFTALILNVGRMDVDG